MVCLNKPQLIQPHSGQPHLPLREVIIVVDLDFGDANLVRIIDSKVVELFRLVRHSVRIQRLVHVKHFAIKLPRITPCMPGTIRYVRFFLIFGG